MSLIASQLLVLTGSNTYTGPTTISAGTLQLGNGRTNGYLSSSGMVNNSSLLVFDPAISQTYGGVISGTGSMTLSGGTLLVLTGTSTYTGLTTISAGTLQIGNGAGAITNGNLSASGTISNAGALAFDTASATVASYGGVISGNGALNTFARRAPGARQHEHLHRPDHDLGRHLATRQRHDQRLALVGHIADGGVLAFDPASATTQTYPGVISGVGSMNKTGAGTLVLTNTNTFSGLTTISAGTLQLGNELVNGSLLSGTISDVTAGWYSTTPPPRPTPA